MAQNKKKIALFGSIVLLVAVLDQITKFWILNTPGLHQYTLIEGWLALHYTKNPGMALGISWADTWVISLVAIFATIVILWYVWKTLPQAGMGYVACMALIVGGATGNIIDRLIQAPLGGYGTVLEGHVVDFIHFKLEIAGTPVFPYIFNVADSAITVAIITLILFFRKLLPEYQFDQAELSEPVADADTEKQYSRAQASGKSDV